MSELEHIHGEDCECGCHDHEHAHHHHHHHEHEEGCECGCHEHEHEHGEDCDCGCHDHEHEHVHGRDVDGIHIEHHMHDSACVVSGVMDMIGVYEDVRPLIKRKLEAVAAAVAALGGIVGHIKASAEVKQTEMFSVTESDAMIKTAPTQEVSVRMAAIVFAVEPEEVEPVVEMALREIRGE